MSDSLSEALTTLAPRRRALAAGDALFRQGDPVRSVFLVMVGEVRLVRALPHGASLVLQRAGAGALLAEASLYARHYHCDAVAAEDSTVGVLPLARVAAALNDEPRLAAALARHLAQEVQRARAQTEILSLKTVAERVDAWFALNGGRLPPKGRWRQMAAEIGVSAEALYRDLARRR